jgi:hypothetical protein
MIFLPRKKAPKTQIFGAFFNTLYWTTQKAFFELAE